MSKRKIRKEIDRLMKTNPELAEKILEDYRRTKDERRTRKQ